MWQQQCSSEQLADVSQEQQPINVANCLTKHKLPHHHLNLLVRLCMLPEKPALNTPTQIVCNNSTQCENKKTFAGSNS